MHRNVSPGEECVGFGARGGLHAFRMRPEEEIDGGLADARAARDSRDGEDRGSADFTFQRAELRERRTGRETCSQLG